MWWNIYELIYFKCALSYYSVLICTISALDAFGKPGSGILVGDYIWLGTYQECQDLTEFHYCLVDLQANVTSVIPATLKDVSYNCIINYLTKRKLPFLYEGAT